MPSDSLERAMSEEAAEAVRQEVIRVVADEGLAWADVARESGVPNGTLTNWKAGTYNGRNDRIAEKMQRWLTSRRVRAATRQGVVAAPKFVETPTADAFMTLFAHAQHMPDFTLGIGAPGIGKTSAACAYTRAHPNVWKITGHPGLQSPRAVLEDLCRALHLPESRGLHKLQITIVQRVRGVGALLIVDEAHHLSTPALEQIRAIHDEAECGVAVMGNRLLLSRLEGRNRDPEFAQLFSRVGMRLTNAREHRARLKGDAEALLDAWGMQEAGARKALHVIARKDGALRGMTKTLKLAHLLANAAHEPVGVTHITAAWERLSETLLTEEAA